MVSVLTEGGLAVSTVHCLTRVLSPIYLPKVINGIPRIRSYLRCATSLNIFEALAAVWRRPIPLLAQELLRTAMQYTVDSQRFDDDWNSMMQLLLEMGVSTINLKVVDFLISG
jgi:hypothetical protein